MRRRHRGKNFLNDPETWELLQKIHALAEPLGLTLLPEIHAAYDEKIYETLAEKGYATYDFFLPGLVIDAIENRRGTHLAAWAKKIVEKKISTVNMLGCYDGIPLLDLKGLLPKEEIERQFQYKGDIKLDYPSTGKIFFNMYEFDL